MTADPAVWFPSVRTGTGTDIFTERLVAGLRVQGLRAEITWLPLRAEYAPWSVPVPNPPSWANVCHISTWLHPRFIPRDLQVVATLHHSVHDPALRAYKGWLRTAYHRFWIAPVERRVLHRANLAVAVSQFVADMAHKTLSNIPMQVIHNGIDINLFTPGHQPHQPAKPFKLLYIGSWTMRKGVDMLAPIMRELGHDFELHYTGGGAAENDKPCMPPNMHDIGQLSVPQVIAAMRSADALLFPTRSEGMPLVILEAMACGLPVIGTLGTAVAEVVTHERTGLLCQVDEIEDFVQAAHQLANDAELAKRMGASACQHVAENYSIDSMIDRYLLQYRQLAVQQKFP